MRQKNKKLGVDGIEVRMAIERCSSKTPKVCSSDEDFENFIMKTNIAIYLKNQRLDFSKYGEKPVADVFENV